MAVYRNIRCGSCGHSVSGGYRMSGGGNPLLGVPVMRCQACGALNRTGKLPWSAMTRSQRRWLIAGAAYRAFMTGLIFSVGVGFLIALVFGQRSFDETAVPWVASLLLGEALSFWYSWRLYRRAIPRIEAASAAKDWDSAPQVI
jgi:hypothetical protein